MAYKGLQDDDVVEVIAPCLRFNTYPCALFLDYNKIQTKGLMSLADALTHNTRLNELSLRRNQFSDESFSVFADVIRSNAHITSLNIGDHPKVTDRGIRHISAALAVNSSLTSLDIDGIHITEEAAASLLTAVKANRTLKQLKFVEGKVSRKIARAIDEQIEINRMLDFPDKYVTFIPQIRGVTSDGYLDLRSLKLSDKMCALLSFKESPWYEAVTIDLSDNLGVTKIPLSLSDLSSEITKNILFTVSDVWDEDAAQVARTGSASEVIMYARNQHGRRDE